MMTYATCFTESDYIMYFTDMLSPSVGSMKPSTFSALPSSTKFMLLNCYTEEPKENMQMF